MTKSENAAKATVGPSTLVKEPATKNVRIAKPMFAGTIGQLPASPMSAGPEVRGAPIASARPLGEIVSPSRRRARLSGSAWVFARRGSGGSLALGGRLGGSQAGARLRYRLVAERARLALSGRVYAPLQDFDAAEAAAGVEWQPSGRLPVRLLAERRIAIGRDGRSAFSLIAYGGVGEQHLAGPLVANAYVQAGVVGLRSRDLFADASLRLGIPVDDRVKIGGGAWAAAQPDVARLDIGPQISWQLPQIPGATLTADWRFRIAGNAEPGSVPALTIATDF